MFPCAFRIDKRKFSARFTPVGQQSVSGMRFIFCDAPKRIANESNLEERTADFQSYWTGVKRATDKVCSRFVEKFKVLTHFIWILHSLRSFRMTRGVVIMDSSLHSALLRSVQNDRGSDLLFRTMRCVQNDTRGDQPGFFTTLRSVPFRMTSLPVSF